MSVAHFYDKQLSTQKSLWNEWINNWNNSIEKSANCKSILHITLKTIGHWTHTVTVCYLALDIEVAVNKGFQHISCTRITNCTKVHKNIYVSQYLFPVQRNGEKNTDKNGDRELCTMDCMDDARCKNGTMKIEEKSIKSEKQKNGC